MAIKNDDVRAEREIESMREHKLDTNEEEFNFLILLSKSVNSYILKASH